MKCSKWILAVCTLAIVVLACGVWLHISSKQKQDDILYDPPTGDTNASVPADEDTAAGLTADPAPHTVDVVRPDIMIYSGPGYDYSDIGTLLAVGTHTITEEETDWEGIPWGCLASGQGWIDLQKASEEAPHIPVTVEIANAEKLTGMDCHEHTVTDSEYTQRLLFRAYEPLTNVRFTMLDVTADDMGGGDALYALDEWTPDTSLVIGVVFFGDLTTFGLSFTDSCGAEHLYMLYTSGRNGSIVMQEYRPHTD